MSAVQNRPVCHIRLWIGVVKILAVSGCLMTYLFLASQQDPSARPYLASLAVLGFFAIVAIIDVSLESIDIAAALVWVLAIVGLLFVASVIVAGIPSADSWAFELGMTGIAVIFLFLQLLLSANDAEMETFASQGMYPCSDHRSGRFLVYLAFNALPYIVGMMVVRSFLSASDAIGAMRFVVAEGSALVLFALVDEYLRHNWHWSFFWHNRQAGAPASY